MQFDTNRAFPYPVLRSDVRDYVRGAFQASIDFRQADEDDSFIIDVQAQLNVREIQQLIEDGKAEFLYVLSCRDTMTRHTLRSKQAMLEQALPIGSLRGEVQIAKLVSVKKPITGYTCEHINPEFGPGPFSFEEGEVLAFDEPHVVYLEPENFRPLTSIFELAPNESLDKFELQFGTSGDRITIELNPDFKALVDNARTEPTKMAVLFNSIYMHAVMDALDKLKDDPEGDQRWRGVIKQKLADLDLDIESLNSDGIYVVASRLLQQPLARLAQFFGDDQESPA
tara:strand:+ start:4831 stop:5679 length:849 start_codon:yes stop_codon:yes gene_type:complete